MNMPFGKHKGTPVDQCPADYLQFILDRGITSEKLKAEVESCLALNNEPNRGPGIPVSNGSGKTLGRIMPPAQRRACPHCGGDL